MTPWCVGSLTFEYLVFGHSYILGFRYVDIGYQLIDIVDRVYDNSRFVWRMQGGCQRVIASQGEQDFLICESVLTGQGDDALLEHDRTELFALGY